MEAQQEDDDDLIIPEILNEVRYKEPVELLTPEQIRKLESEGYDMKRIFYSSYEEIRRIRLRLEKQEADRLYQIAYQQQLLEIQKQSLTVTEDLRDITADEVVRTNQWRNDEIARRYQSNEPSLLFKLVVFYFVLMSFPVILYLSTSHLEPSNHNKFHTVMEWIFPILNFIPWGF